VVPGADSEDAATEERISQILSEAQAAMQKKHTDEQVYVYCLWPRIVFIRLTVLMTIRQCFDIVG